MMVIPLIGCTAALGFSSFVAPPAENRPECWWWFSDKMSERAIVHDLDAMARVGLSGFHFYGGDRTKLSGIEKCRFALREAGKRGLRASIVIGSAGCNHPTTADEHLQKGLVFGICDVIGGRQVSCEIPRGTAEGAVERLYRDIAVLAVPKAAAVDPDSVIDLTDLLTDETLSWADAPKGEWTVIRVGYMPHTGGTYNAKERFLDHMSREAFDAHWQTVMMPLLRAVTPKEKSILRGVVCDSWEAGTCSWTEGFETEFARRRGYDIRRWLPFKAGFACSDAKASRKFLRDFDLTVEDLIVENHYGYKKEVAGRYGLLAITEAAGPHQHLGDGRRMQGKADVAMGEFWAVSEHRPGLPQRYMLRDSAMAAHVYGIHEVLAEAFTQMRTCWTSRPRDLKTYADRAFCEGLTRVCYHGFDGAVADQPRRGVFAHLAGMHYNPQLTWFDQSWPLNLYLSRCSWMCSQGVPVADCLLYAGDGKGILYGMRRPDDGLGYGFDYDVAPTELLLLARVENGEIVLPSDARYRVLFVSDRNPDSVAEMGAGGRRSEKKHPPRYPFLPPEADKKLSELARAGATVLRTRSELNEFLNGGMLPPDVVVKGAAEEDVGWVHRRAGDADIYFFANYRDVSVALNVELRSSNRVVSLCDAVTGERTHVVVSETTDGRAGIRLDLSALGSVFVVLESAGELARPPSETRLLSNISGPWTIRFNADLGGPVQPIATTNLFDWTESSVEGVRYYSGTASYRTEFVVDSIDADYVLDLGQVADVAEVILNGQTCGIAWTDPMCVDLGSTVRKGRNELEVRVTNRWFNRFVLDEDRPLGERVTLPAFRKDADKYRVTHSGDKPFTSGLLGPVRLLRANRGMGK